MKASLSTRVFGALPAPRDVISGLLHLDAPGVALHAGMPRGLIGELCEALRHERSRLPVTAVTAFAPAPEAHVSSSPVDALRLCSPDREERHLAVTAALETLRVAEGVEARIVVLALGEAALDPGWTRVVRDFARGEPPDFFERRLEERDKASELALDGARHALDRLIPAAADMGLTLAIPNRARFYQVPSALELAALLADFAGAPVASWLDVGAAHAAYTVEGRDPAEWLDLNLTHAVGVSAADAAGPRRGLPPGMGEIGYQALAARVYDAKRQLVLNLTDGFSEAEIRSGAALLEQIWVPAKA